MKNITDLSLREVGEYYIGDVIQVKKPGWSYVKNATIAGYNHRDDMWVISYHNTDSGVKYDEISEQEIVLLKDTTIKLNTDEELHKNMIEIEKFMKEHM